MFSSPSLMLLAVNSSYGVYVMAAPYAHQVRQGRQVRERGKLAVVDAEGFDVCKLLFNELAVFFGDFRNLNAFYSDVLELEESERGSGD